MTITLELPDSTERQLQQEALRAGLSVPDYILQLITHRAISDEDWMKEFNSGHVVAGVSLTDEQTRREVIYSPNEPDSRESKNLHGRGMFAQMLSTEEYLREKREDTIREGRSQ